MKRIIRTALAAVLAVAAAAAAAGQPAQAAEAARAAPAAPADVASVDAVLAALYNVISGPAGAPRDWDRLRSLFAPEGRMAAVSARPAGGFGLRSMTVEDYIARNAQHFAAEGFYESELARTSEAFGQVVQVFSTYEARKAPGAAPFARGINSIQLYHDGARWWIVSVLWRAEDARLALPARYLESH